MDFEQKYYKYKAKYLQFKNAFKQTGGELPEWYAQFEIDLLALNQKLQSEFPMGYAFTGSAAVALMARGMNKLELLNILPKPNDFDIVAVSESITGNLFGYEKKQKTTEKSQTFEKIENNVKKSFDIITVKNTGRRLMVNGIPVYSPNSILTEYKTEEREDKRIADEVKKAVLERLIKLLQLETYPNVKYEEEKKSKFELEEEKNKENNTSVAKSLFF